MVTEFLFLVKRKNTIQSVNLKRETLYIGVVERGDTKRRKGLDLKGRQPEINNRPDYKPFNSG